MARIEIDHDPIDLGKASKTDLRTQFGVLPYRIKAGDLQICLITSRVSGRWIVPKGWPMDGATPTQAAATEAYEEAGLEGRVRTRPLGVFSYYKSRSKDELPCIAVLFPMKVKKVLSRWPERKQRKRKWVSRKKAAQMVEEPELRQLIANFDPRLV